MSGLLSAIGKKGLKDAEWDLIKLCKEGCLQEALQIVDLMTSQEGILVSIKFYVCLLKWCIRSEDLEYGKYVHTHIIERGEGSNIYLVNNLVDMYGKCGSLLDASQVFKKMAQHNVFSWTQLISAYTKHGQGKQAIDLFQQMQCTGVAADKYVFSLVLQACANLTTLEHGKQVHTYAINSGLESDVFVESALVDMYAKCKSINNAREVFDRMKVKDVVSWTAIITAYIHQGYSELALTLFAQMQQEGVQPNTVTFMAILQACASPTALERGRQVHAYIIKNTIKFDVFLGNTLIDMYTKCGSIEDACQLFCNFNGRDVVSWNAMIAGCAQHGLGKEALILFEEMWRGDTKPDDITFVGALKACTLITDLKQAKLLHERLVKNSFESDEFVQSTLVDMYAKCRSMENARQVFDNMQKRDVVSWTAMIAGYTDEGHGKKALALVKQMKLECVKPDDVTFISSLKSCASLGTLHQGRHIHSDIVGSRFDSNILVRNTLVDMYAKCGSLWDANEVFENMSVRDSVSWNTMILGYAQQGLGKQALTLFEQMQKEGKKPDEATFLFVLSACKHAGLANEGGHYFNSMSQNHGIQPTMNHYACMVDLLGRIGRVDEAEDLVTKMQAEPDVVVWMSLLGACRNNGNLDIGIRAFEHVRKLEPKIPGAYVLLSNLFAMAGSWEDVAKIRNEMDDLGVKKETGYSWIEVGDEVHTFLAADRGHPQSKKIQVELKRLTRIMQEEEYASNLSFVLHNTVEESKEDALCEHSEKLAIAFGLINTPPRTPIRIMKNLRLCSDCHGAFKIISKKEAREILARDASRFHHFKDGVCSCGDYW